MASNKRRSISPGEDSSSQPHKRARKTTDNLNNGDVTEIVEENEIDLSQIRDFQTAGNEAEVGVIEHITLKNFMCHTRLDFSFSPHVNFVVGRNGSGKSAVLTALVVGLGGKTRATNRGSSIKGLIKAGKATADVIIKLRNRGQGAYKPEIYGDSIIVERRLTRQGTTSYKLKNAEGRVISPKREELAHILDCFNIQVENPLSILNQDCSREFLHSRNDKDKYKFFLKATLLEEIRTNYRMTEEAKRVATDVIKQKEELVSGMLSEVKQLEEQYKASRTVDKLQDKIQLLQNEQGWAIITIAERELETGKNMLMTEEGRKYKYTEKVVKSQDKLKKLTGMFKELDDQIQNMAKEAEELEPQYHGLKTRVEEAKAVYRKTRLECKKVENELRVINNDYKAVTKRLEDLRKSAKDYEPERKMREEKIATLQEDLDRMKATKRTTEQEKEQYQAAVTKYKEDLYRLRTEQKEAQQQLDQMKRQLGELHAAKDNHMKRFGSWMPELLNAIQNHYKRGAFHKLPRGPLGSYLKLRDKKWALAIERCLGTTLHAFAVTNHQDERMLESLFKKYCPEGKKPAIITSPFQDRVYDVHKHCAKTHQYPTVLNMLQVDDPVVINFFIDQRTIECVLLIENNEEARRVMIHQPPLNARECFTLIGDQAYAAPSFRYYSSDRKKANILTSNVEESIIYCEEILARLQTNLRGLQDRRVELDMQVEKNDKQAKASHTRLMKIIHTISKTDFELTELKEAEVPSPVDVSTWEEEAERTSENLRAQEEKMKQCKDLEDAASESLRLKEEEFRELHSRIDQLTARTDPFKEERTQLELKLEKEKADKLHYERKRKEFEEELRKRQEEIHQQEEKLKVDLVKAESLSARIRTRRSPDDIQKEIQHIRKQIERQKEIQGDPEEIAAKYREKKDRYDKIQTEITQLNNFLKELAIVMQKRNSSYNRFRRTIAMRAKIFFLNVLNHRNYMGKLTFDHEKETLSMTIEKMGNAGSKGTKDMKALSGGERSFATVSFMVALWESIEAPFRCLDEYDVFMDLVNRRIATDVMLNMANNQKAVQFIFLTPQDLSLLNLSNNIKIWRMPDPHRGQGIINFEPENAEVEEEEEETEDASSRKRKK